MTTKYFETKIERKLKNVGELTLRVLKALLNEQTTEDIQSDALFVQKVLEFIKNPNNIWKTTKFEYDFMDEASIQQRKETIKRIAEELQMEEENVKEAINRLMNALRRSQLSGKGIEYVFGLTHPGVSIDKLIKES